MKTAAHIRSEFLKYFEKNGHTVVGSSSLIPENDPTLLFTNAGMVQFKDVFLGSDPRPYKRAASAQKCVRAGGKHNDLERVGFTARHHTFFEMLGNFSFGDYFKKEAIHFAWEFVTKNLGLNKSKLYITVHTSDNEAAEIWHKQEHVSLDRISKFDEDNFWAMGATGPCGPCSEIFIDRGNSHGCGKPTCSVGCTCDRFMEIWNLVFMQYNRSTDGNLSPLPRPSIDTGMGLERVASVVQDVASNYDTDLFQSLIGEISAMAQVSYHQNEKTDVSLRVIADHCRATNFLIADGVLPSNEGRGYVLRRIMRRAIRHGKNLGFQEPFFYKLTSSLIQFMGSAYSELNDKRAFLESTIRLEEERFLVTLDKGLLLLEDLISKSSKDRVISGADAFKLYDTFGFPLDLTQVIATERNFNVDEAGFNKCMEEQRVRSREHWKGSGEESVDELYKRLHQQGLKSKFLGYHSLSSDGKVLAIIEEGKLVNHTSTGRFQLVVDQTPFYAESGGQVADQGEISGLGGFRALIEDVQKPVGDLIVLYCHEAKGALQSSSVIQQNTKAELRARTTKNHTATHMLHHALQKFVGPHVKQAGSLVSPELLRFDFTHNKALTSEEIERVEDFINEHISYAEAVQVEEMEKEKALKKGAIAFFGEKYGAQVRVVSVGSYSTELCGGTHVKNTVDIQAFKILSESGIAAGIRRIVAITGPAIYLLLREKDQQLKSIMGAVKASAPAEVITKIEKMQQTEKELRRTLEVHSKKAAGAEIEKWISDAVLINGGKFIRAITEVHEGENPTKVLRDLADNIRNRLKHAVIALGAKDKTKNQSLLLVAITKDWTDQYQANEIIKNVAPVLEGSGGGKPDFAQAGGKNENFHQAFEAIEKLLKR